MGKVIGIDLGTTNSCVSISDGRKSSVISNKGGYRTTPSVVAVLEKGRVLVGQVAKRQAITNPTHTVTSTKRLIGRRINAPEVKLAKAIYPYKIVEGPNSDIRIECYKHQYSLPQISSYVLAEMKRVAETYLNEPVKDAVITVPAYFNDGQRQATKDAGRIAGLNVLRVINEPTAAAIAYGFNKKKNKIIAVYDLGGGTFDISILEIREGVFKVLATAGNSFLGGDDFDNLLMDFVAEQFFKDHGVDVRKDRMSLQRLRDECERVKKDLSLSQKTELQLPFIQVGNKEPLHLKILITRKNFEVLTKHLVEQTLEITEKCMKEAGVDKNDLDDVLMIGGQTRMPFVVDQVSNFLGRSATRQINPDEAVAIGAAIQGLSLAAESEIEMLLLDVTPMPLGIRSVGGSFARLIDANTTVPVSAKKTFTTVTDNQRTVRIQAYQGFNPIAEENTLLGEFVLEGIRKAKAGEPEIEVFFHIDANGILNVSAQDKYTGKAQSITVTMSSGLDEEEIEKMREETEAYEVRLKDEEEAEALAQKSEVLVHQLKKSFETKSGKLSEQKKTKIKRFLGNGPGVFQEKGTKELKKFVELLEKALKELQ